MLLSSSERRLRLPPTRPVGRSSYYNADTADLEIGQEFEDAEAEEEAALELQRASYKRLDPADYGEEEEEGEGEGEGSGQAGEGESGASGKQAQKGKGKGKSPAGKRLGEAKAASAKANGAALLAMKSDLEQIALGAGAGVSIVASVHVSDRGNARVVSGVRSKGT